MDAPGLDDVAFCHLMLKYLEQSIPETLLSTPRRYAIYLPSRAPTSSDRPSFSSGLYMEDWPAPASTASQYSRSSASPSVDYGSENACISHDDWEHTESPTTSDIDLAHFASPDACLEPSYGPWLQRGVKIKYRQSSHDALLKARDEVTDTRIKRGIQAEKGFPCLRPGCQDRLEDLRALTYHLHIHNMTDACDLGSRVDGMHGSGCYFEAPTCHGSYRILPLNRIRRIISKLIRRR